MTIGRLEREDPDQQPPIVFRLVTAVGRPIGLRWVPDNYVRTIFRMESYYAARGPRFFWLNGWLERLGPIVYVGPRFQTYIFPNLSTRDPLRVGLRVSLSYTFDPRETTLEIAAQLITLDSDVLALIVEGAALKALRSQVAERLFEEIRHGSVYEEIEQSAIRAIGADPGVRQLGMSVGSVQIVEPLLPDKIETRFEETAQRRFNIQATRDFQPSDVVKTLAMEIVEKINSTGEQYLNASDILSAVQQLPPPPLAPVKTIEGQATVKPLDAPASSTKLAPPSSSSDSTSGQPGPASPTFLDEESN